MDLNLLKLIREATKNVPAVKYGIGILGLVAIVAIIASLKVDLRIAFWGTVILIALMILFVVFAKLTQVASIEFLYPIKVLMWFTVILFMVICIVLFTSVFFSWPVDLQYWLKDKKKSFNPVFTLLPDKKLNISQEYPAPEYPLKIDLVFPDNTESVIINGDEFNNQGSRPVDVQFLNAKVPLSFKNKYWEVETDSLTLNEQRNFIALRPNRSLAIIQGTVKSWDEKKLISGAKVHLGTDTILYTNESGLFRALLPYSMLKVKHRITVYAKGYEPVTDDGYPYNAASIPFKLHPSK